jgi:cysteine desulfuration protein SufE
MAINSTLLGRQDKIIAEFQSINGWEDRYKKIIEMGKALPELPENLKVEEAKVKGCQSQVWLHASLDASQRIVFQGDSDALIVRGLVALLLQVYSGSRPEEILASPPQFLKAIGFEGNLSPSRANGLFAMIKQIQMFAMAFQYQIKS